MAPKTDSVPTTTDDGFHRAGERLLKAMANNPKSTRGALLGLLVALVAVWGGLTVSRARAKEAGFALVEAFALRDAPLASDLAAKKAAPVKKHDQPKDDDGDDGDDDKDDDGGDDDETLDEAAGGRDPSVPEFADAKARNAAAYRAFVAIAKDHPGSLGTLAALEAAAILEADPAVRTEAQAPAQATLELLAHAAAPLSGPSSIRPIAALREAQLAEDAGDVTGALAHVERIIASQIHFLGDEAQIMRARLLMQQGDLPRAREALEFVQNNYPRSALGDELRIEMAALDAKMAEAPNTPARPAATSAG